MISSIQSLVRTTQRAFGFAGDEVSGLKEQLLRKSGGALLRRKRVRVAMFAILFGIVSAAIELPLPAEDFYRAVRAELRSRPAPRDIVMIAIDDKTLKQRGISLSIDDFGTGQSNLEYIEKLPSSELKIDKRLVQNMASSEESRAVVRATIEIAHSLGKIVVAEGVETPAVADELRAMGCD
jgi:hypothetical protein